MFVEIILAGMLKFIWDQPYPATCPPVCPQATADGIRCYYRPYGDIDWGLGAQVGVDEACYMDHVSTLGLMEVTARGYRVDSDITRESADSNYVLTCVANNASCEEGFEGETDWVHSSLDEVNLSDDVRVSLPLFLSFPMPPLKARAFATHVAIGIEARGGEVRVIPVGLGEWVENFGQEDEFISEMWFFDSFVTSVILEQVSGNVEVDEVTMKWLFEAPTVCDIERERYRICCQQVGMCEQSVIPMVDFKNRPYGVRKKLQRYRAHQVN
jgi:hypothetical protein